MKDYESDAEERTDLDERDVRALTEYLTVLENQGRVRGCDDLYEVVSASGRSYLVDAREETCECPDHEHRGVHCKHLRRVAFATGDRSIPGSVDGVDPSLGEHVSASPRAVATDGGQVLEREDGKGSSERVSVESDDDQQKDSAESISVESRHDSGSENKQVAESPGETDDERPDDCSCLPSFDDLPCFSCHRDGFKSPNPDATEDDQ